LPPGETGLRKTGGDGRLATVISAGPQESKAKMVVIRRQLNKIFFMFRYFKNE
jgi:hypothetical protein